MIIYTDGACSKNGSADAVGGFGVVVLDDNENLITSYHKQNIGTTNNREELRAILWSMINYGNRFLTPPIVYSDSAYAVNSFNNWMFSWQKNDWFKSNGEMPENLDLIKAYYDLWLKGYRIDLRKCVGHAGNKWNEMADRLAVAAKDGPG